MKNDDKLIEAGQLYAKEVETLILNAERNGRKVGAFIAEALQSCGGQIIYPKKYLKTVTDRLHEHGGLIIIDEVQTGFGRVGQTFWAHQLDGTIFGLKMKKSFRGCNSRYSYNGEAYWKWISGSSCCDP